jgi:amino acid adenylation domain-containing protein
MLDHNPNLLVGMLAILKSGNGFAPIDPRLPNERINFVINDCRIEVIVTEQKYLERAAQISASNTGLKHIVCLDRAHVEGADTGGAAIYDFDDYAARQPGGGSTGDPGDLAYAIYTSGSTGAPKGVPISHANLMPLLRWSGEYFGLNEQTKVLQNLSYWFDFGVFELVTTLLYGGTIYFLDRDELSDPLISTRLINREKINTLHSTPSFFAEMISGGERLDELEVLHLGGEQLTANAVEEIFKAVGDGCTLYNGYGPTEASINCSIYKVGTKAAHDRSQNIPVGKPTANNFLYILDARGNPVPTGVIGELHVGGKGLSQGYLNRPDLTAERFVPDTYGSRPGQHLYRTGDLARFLPDGNIEFLGRIDHQVKVRGFRIELGEIESALSDCPGVREAVVLAREGQNTGRRLAAYLTRSEGQELKAGDLRSRLKERLPDYMIPSFFVILDELPLTANGKVDRRALPAPDRARSDQEEAAGALRAPDEEVIAGVCAEVLGLERIGRDENLFDLGCHSLLATRIVSRLREAFQVELPLLSIFTSPTVRGLSESVESSRASGYRSQAPPIKRAPRGADLPLSFAQERVWFLNELLPDNISYYVPRAVRLVGNLYRELLEQSFTQLVRRHEILRTTFPAKNGRPVQVIHEPYRVEIPLLDLEELSKDEQENLIQQTIVEAGQRPFDLANGPLLRLLLLKLAPQEHVLILTEHHLIHDGWTQGVLLRDFLNRYSALHGEEVAPLPELAIQYADFAHWQRGWMQGEVLESLISYWKKELSGAAPLLELPTDHPRPAVQGFRGGVKYFDLPTRLARSLRALSRKEGVTLFMTMLAAFKSLLYRYTNQHDLIVGAGIANRRLPEIEGMLGMVINTVVLRTRLAGGLTFREYLKIVRDVCLGAYTHQDIPFEKLVEVLQPPRSLSYTPIFQVMFSFLDTPMPELRLPELDLSIINAHNRSAKFDLDVLAIPHGEQRIGYSAEPWDERITMMWEYSTDLFDESTIERMHGHFQNVLEEIVGNPEINLSQLDLLTRAERRQLTLEWNDTAAAPPPQQIIHRGFEAQVARTPDALALIHGKDWLTYRKLNRRSNRLAHRLRGLGVGPDVLVGIYFDRCPEMIVALLATLKAGGAYVPLDPAYPNERLSFIVEDAGVSVILTQKNLAARFASHGAKVICLDEDLNISGLSEADPACNVSAENLAYVIYTSGSTGRPKGVMITHGSLTNLTESGLETYALSDTDRMLQFASMSFDTSAEEIFTCLTSGGTLVLRTDDMLTSASVFLASCESLGVTVLDLPTAYWHELAENLASDRLKIPPSLRLVIIGGERALPEHAARWFRHVGRNVKLINSYGPSEATIVATLCELTPPERANDVLREVSIGKPIRNARVYLLDEFLNPVPVGVTGALYIGGEGLARGYLKRPDLTAESFIPDLLGGESGARLYRTGDLARRLPDGSLEFVGRGDDQVKLRGYRIQLSEIEGALAEHPAVGQAAVLMIEDEPGHKRLAAYVTRDRQHDLAVDQLREFLKERLPDYMIPSAYTLLEEFPYTPNGKLDRRALPAPDKSRAYLEQGYVAPRTEVEEELSRIWADLLHVERVGVEENFFDAGGHSLLATQLLSRIRSNFAVELTLREFFMSPVLKDLVEILEDRMLIGADSEKLDRMLDALDSMDDDQAQSPLALKALEGVETADEEPRARSQKLSQGPAARGKAS